jgi:hypothetical protein
MGLRGAAFKVGALLNGKRLVMNIANHMRPRFNKRSAMQVPLYLTIDFDEPFCRDIAYNLQSVTNDRSITL